MTIEELEQWAEDNGLQDLKSEIQYVLSRYYGSAALFDEVTHEDAAKDLMELLVSFWEELGYNEDNRT